jgi:hypothetical protein
LSTRVSQLASTRVHTHRIFNGGVGSTVSAPIVGATSSPTASALYILIAASIPQVGSSQLSPPTESRALDEEGADASFSR